MNVKYSYHIHKYNTRHSHDLHCTTSVFEDGIFIIDIKSYNKLPERIKILHSIIIKIVEISTFAKRYLYCRGIYTGIIVVAVCIRNWINKGNYTYIVNFIYILVFMWWPCTVECFVFNLCILFVCWHGVYIVVTCPILCDSMVANKY